MSGMSRKQLDYMGALATQLGLGDALDLIADRYEDCDRHAAKRMTRSMTTVEASETIEWALGKIELRTPHARAAALAFDGAADYAAPTEVSS